MYLFLSHELTVEVLQGAGACSLLYRVVSYCTSSMLRGWTGQSCCGVGCTWMLVERMRQQQDQASDTLSNMHVVT